MPSRSRPFRAVLLLLALLSAVGLGDAQRSACPMHGGASAEAMASPMSGGADIGMDTHVMHARHHGGSSHHDSDGCDCTCIGDCSTTAPVATLPSATTLRVATIAAQPRVEPEAQSADAAPPASPDRRLPFANGPPATRLS
jgi:hypothetical protein